MKIMCPPNDHHTGFVVTLAPGYMMSQKELNNESEGTRKCSARRVI